MTKKFVIGYLDNTYPNERCIKNKTQYTYEMLNKKIYGGGGIKRLKNRIIRYIYRKLRIKYPEWDKQSYLKGREFKNIKNLDLIHVFNYIFITKKAWVTTFESETPVTDSLIGREWERSENYHFSRLSVKLLKKCTKSNCKGLIAISKSAYNIQATLIDRSPLNKKSKEIIKSKLYLIHPPQKLLCNELEIEDKFYNIHEKELTFIIVGHDFFRKGGKQIVNSLMRFYQQGYKFKLIIVSKLNYGDYASETDIEDFMYIKQVIENESWIEYYEYLDNKEVVELAKTAHIGLLPSIADTYGYSVLELQACGCACVTTNIRALGEINNNERGWICDIKPNEFGECVYGSSCSDYKREIQDVLEKELSRNFEEIFSNKHLIKFKAMNSYLYIKENHSFESYSKMIEKIYKS